MRAELYLAPLALTAIISIACGDGGSPLAKDPVGGAGGVGGMGGSSAETTTTSTGQGGVGGIVEPPGPTKVTIVNGVVDADAVRFCFTPFPGGTSNLQPWPGPMGLDYARSGIVDPITSVFPEGTDVEAHIIAGDLNQVGAATCGDLVASPPAGVLVRSAGLIPESALVAERSLIFASNGCVGGPGHEDENDDEICGDGYDPTFGNAGLVAGFMSRLSNFDKISMQFVQASRATSPFDLRIKNNDTAPPNLVLPLWSLGAIAPFPPYTALSRLVIVVPDDAQLGLYAQGNAMAPVREVAWSTIFANSPLTASEVDDGDHLVFVAVGPAPTLGAGAWWKGFTFTVVDGDPD